MPHSQPDLPRTPVLMPLGDSALVIRYASAFDLAANRAAIAMARLVERRALSGVVEVVPNLVSVLVRFNPLVTKFSALSAEVRLLTALDLGEDHTQDEHRLTVRFGGDDGPDLDTVAGSLDMTPRDFITAHNQDPLRVLATGFAPGFVYCGMHRDGFHLPRRAEVRRNVPAGSVIFAAGQTAVAATPIPTGWHVIGRTDFRNFDPQADPPTRIRPGDTIAFEVSQ